MPAAKPKTPKRKGTYTVVKPTSVALRLVQPYIVDKIVRWARDDRQNPLCEIVEEGLEQIFKKPATGWRDSDGYDCDGYDSNGYDRDGYDSNGYHRETGRDEDGYDKDGYDKDGLSRYGQPRNADILIGWPLATKRKFFEALAQDRDLQQSAQEEGRDTKATFQAMISG